MRNHRIIKADFRLCSTCLSRSQAGLCLYTLRLVSNQPEPTFARLRYLLGGDRPSQTTPLTLFLSPDSGDKVRCSIQEGWYLTSGSTSPDGLVSKPPTYPAHPAPDTKARL